MAFRPLASLILLLSCLQSSAMPLNGQSLGFDSGGPQLLVGGKPSDPKLLPSGVGRYMVYVKEGPKKRAEVQAVLREHMGSSYKEGSVLKLIPMFVAEMDKEELVELLTSDSFHSVREVMGSSVSIEPDGVVSIPENPSDMMNSGLPYLQEELR